VSGRRCPVEAIEYNEASRELYVQLRGGVVYTYFDVPLGEAAAFESAELRGVHYMRHIRDVYRSCSLTCAH